MTNRKVFFNEAADTWDKQFQTKELTAFLEQLVPTFGLVAGQRVLDAGTGTGILVPFLLQAVGPNGQVIAVDYAEKMVNRCKAKYMHLPNVIVTVQQVENLVFSSEIFDAVVCFGLFPHLENKEEALHQINRVLKAGGKLIIAHSLSSGEIEIHHHKASAVVAHDVLPNRVTMKQMLKHAGFTGVHIIDKPGCYLCTANKQPA